MANVKITELTALTAPADGDVFPIIDISEGVSTNRNKKISYGEFFKSVLDGTAAAPAIAFEGSTTGIYKSAANELSISTGGTQRLKIEANGATTIFGNLTVQGTQTTVSSTTLEVADKNIELAKGAGNDTAADGGGITLDSSDGDKLFKWLNSTDSWTSSEHLEVASGKTFRINGNNVLSQTTLGSTVVSSSLTSVGTLTGLTINGDMTLTGAANNVVWDKSDNALEFADNAKARFGASNDLEIYHTGSESFIADEGTGGITISSGVLSFKNQARDETFATMTVNGSVDLYYDNSKKLETISTGVKIHGSLVPMDGNRDLGTSSLVWQDLHIGNDIHVADSGKIIFGAGDDLQIYHDGSNSYINESGTGNLKILSGGVHIKNAADNAYMAFFGSTGASELYFNGGKKFETSNTGATLTGTLVVDNLDVGTDVDVDGTLEADAYTVNGTALNEYIADTVGAMVSSNTETNITVTYEDSDNTLDFVIGTLNQDTTGNAATATALETARTIGGVSFNGTANINLPGVNQTGNQNTTGSAATLTTARTIGGVSFDGSANISLPGVNAAGNQNTSGTAAGLSGTPTITVNDVVAASLDISGDADIDGTLEADAYTVNGTALNEYIADTVGAMVSSNTETNISVTYQDSDNTLDFSVVNITGNAATATALQTARTIGGVSFDGTANITLPGVNSVGNQNTTGSAATLTTARTIGGVSFDGSANITLPGVNSVGNQNTTGSAATLTTARTIGGVSFDGSANITLPGVNSAGNQNTSGTSAGLTGTPNITVADVVAASLDISGNADIDGTLEADAITVDGTALNEFIADTVGAMVSSNTESDITVVYQDSDNTLDFTVANISGTAGGLSGTPNITVGDVVAASLDISGNVDVDGTLETDALTINGTSLSETIADTVGAMVTSNTETGITVTYDDADNTLDFVVGTLNQNTTGNAATATALQNARTINGVSFDGTGNITVTAAAGTLTGSTLTSGVTASSLTSVGTLTGLTTSGNILMTGTGCIDVAAGTSAQRPGSPTAGMFRFNTTDGQFEGHDGSSWGEIGGGGGGGSSFYINTLSSSSNTGGGSATFNGTAYRFTISNAPSTGNAAQMLVSVGGVIQKANTGTSQPSEGYAIDGNDIIFGAAPASAASWFIITYGALNAGTPTDNTVTTLKLVNDAVTGAKIADNAIDSEHYVDGSIDNAHLSANSVLAVNIATGAVTGAEIGADAVGSAHLAPGGVDTTALSDNAVTGAKIADNLDIPDNNTIRFGTGNDLQIFHQSSDESAVIKNINDTGWLRILSGDSNSSGILLKNRDDDVTYLKAFNEGAIELYHSNNKKLETRSDGVLVSGNIQLNDSNRLDLGNNGDLRLYHDGSNSHLVNNTGWLMIKNDDTNTSEAIYIRPKGDENSVILRPNAAVELYYDNSKKFETASNGIAVAGQVDCTSGGVLVDDNYSFSAGTGGDFLMYHNGSNSYLSNSTGNLMITGNNSDKIHIRAHASKQEIVCFPSAQVELYYNDSKRFNTSSSGAQVHGDLFFDDNDTIKIGSGQDLNLYHNGSHSRIDHVGTGNLYINTTSAKTAISCIANGAIQLWYDNSKKFETTSTGTKVTGRINVVGNYETDDNNQIRLGSNNDLALWHDGTDSHLHNTTGVLKIRGSDVRLMHQAGSEITIRGVANGAAELYYDGTKKLNTESSGVSISAGHLYLGDDYKVQFGASQDLQIFHAPSDDASKVINKTGHLHLYAEHAITLNKCDTSGAYVETYAKFLENGGVELYYDGVKKVETTSAGFFFDGTGGDTYWLGDSLKWRYTDNVKGCYGTGDDLQIYHNGTDSFITNSTGVLNVVGNGNIHFESSNNGGNHDEATVQIIKTGNPTSKTMLLLQNGSGSGDIGAVVSHIDFSWRDGNANCVPQARITAHVGDGGDPNTTAKEGRGFLTFHCSDTSTSTGEIDPTEHFRIAYNGTLTATDTSIGSNSDSRLKKDVADYSYSLATFKQFKPKTFNWINPALHGNRTSQRGFVAQEIAALDNYLTGQHVIAEADAKADYDLVTDGVVNTTKLVEKDAMYVSVIQQLISKIEVLETKVAALESA